MRQPLRVLMTADAVGGVWQYALDLTAALVAEDVAVTVALFGPAPAAHQRAEAARAGVVLMETGLPLDWLCDGPEPVRLAAARLAAIARGGGYDLLHCNTPALLAETNTAMPVVAVAHGCLSTWWEAANGTEPDPAFAWQRALTGAGLAAADVVIAPTEAFASTVERHYRLAVRPTAVHNGRRPIAEPDGEDQDIVFTAGRLWDQVKETSLLDRVAARIGAPFHAAGPLAGPNGEMVAPHQLRWAGVLDEAALGRWLSRRPIFVSAARFEPFGLAVLEAAAAGCPLVLADLPTFRELWDGAAAFVQAGDEDGFVAAIERLRSDAPLRARAGVAARKRAGRYTPEATAAAMATIYRDLLPTAGAAVAA